MLTGNRPLSTSHGPRVAYPDGVRVEEVVARRAAELPHAVALRMRDTDVTYAELLAEARTVAARLTDLGVGAGDVVAVRAARSPRLVSALLGVLMTGAAYACVPVDWPQRRHHALLRRTGAVLCLADEPAEAPSDVPVVGIAGLFLPSAEDLAPAVPRRRAEGDACCVFFTSGTTGEPKAALAPHRGIVRTALDPAHVLPGPMVSLQIASPAWDVFALELWVPLLGGGTCVIHEGSHLTGADLRAHVRRGVNTVALPATLFNALVEDDLDAFTGLRLLLTGGARASAEHIGRCRDAHPRLRVVNDYGPVENTISTAAWVAEGDIPDEVPIGTPVANTSVHLLDEQHAVVPRGERGQLAVSGDGLSLGYLGDDAETQRRFPVVPLPGGPRRVYLTGDIARMDDDGRLFFLGRRDRQFKVRGLRIEAEEIERLTEAVPGVVRACALALPLDAPAKTQLAVFYVGAPAAVPADDVRRALRISLPAAFVPDLLMPLAELPLGVNGKIDQRALEAVAQGVGGGQGDADERVSGDGTVTGVVLETVAELLGHPVSPSTDLFRCGATSLTAIRLATRLGSRLARRIGASDVLTARTPRNIADLLDTCPPDTARTAPDDAERDGRPRRVPLVQGGFWAASRDAGHLDEDIIPMVYRLSAEVDPALLGAAVDAVVARHEALRARFSDGPRLPDVHIVPADRTGPLLDTRPAVATSPEAEADARAWVLRPFDLTSELPIRAALFPVANGESLLAIAVHHIAFDGWSCALLLRDLERAYTALAAGLPAFTDTPASYYRAAADQWDRFRENYPQAVWSWMNRVRGAGELRFPLGAQRPWSGPAAELPLKITEDLRDRVDRAAAAAGATGMAVYHAAYTRLLRSFTGSPEPVVAVPSTGRFTEETTAVVGCFASMLPLRAPGTAQTARELVLSAAEQLREAMHPPLVPLEAIMPELPQGSHRHPLLQAYLLQVELPSRRLALGNGSADYLYLAPERALPELTVELWLPPADGGVLRYRTDAVPEAEAAGLAERLLAEVLSICEELERSPQHTESRTSADNTHLKEER
ncbi:AMP-binding protein [Streptomyces morookaense]|uniref:AMP-binding protein n=1 Tax=Streptomyces morookaense TaxID=1970 RepID=UPI0033C34A13